MHFLSNSLNICCQNYLTRKVPPPRPGALRAFRFTYTRRSFVTLQALKDVNDKIVKGMRAEEKAEEKEQQKAAAAEQKQQEQQEQQQSQQEKKKDNPVPPPVVEEQKPPAEQEAATEEESTAQETEDQGGEQGESGGSRAPSDREGAEGGDAKGVEQSAK